MGASLLHRQHFMAAQVSLISAMAGPGLAAVFRPQSWTVFWANQFAPYIKGGKFKTIEHDGALTQGIRALATPTGTLPATPLTLSIAEGRP
jgi:hypothetical protein